MKRRLSVFNLKLNINEPPQLNVLQVVHYVAFRAVSLALISFQVGFMANRAPLLSLTVFPRESLRRSMVLQYRQAELLERCFHASKDCDASGTTELQLPVRGKHFRLVQADTIHIYKA